MTQQQWVLDRLFWVKIATVCLWSAWVVSIAWTGFRRDLAGKPIGVDHLAFYSAARLVNEGRGPLMYDYAFLAEYQAELVQWNGGWDPYRNPPFYAGLYTLTARLPYIASYWIWAFITGCLLYGGLRAIGPSQPRAYFIWACSFFPVFAVIGFGQNSMQSFAIFCAVFFLLEKNQRFLAGMTAGLLLFKPQLLLGVGVWWAIDCRRYWPGVLGGMVTGAILVAGSFIFLPEETREYIRRFQEIAQYDAFEFYNLHTPRAFGALICRDDKRAGNYLAACCAVAAIACFIAFWRRCRDDLPIVYAAMIFLTLWASPHTMIYEWSIVLVSAVLFWERVPELRPRFIPLFALAWVVLFVSTPFTKWQLDWTRSGPDQPGCAVQLSVPVLAVVAILVGRRLAIHQHQAKSIPQPKT